MSRLLNVGATFHCEDCLPARVPGPVQRQCADAFIEGRGLIPPEVNPELVDSGTAGAPATLADGAQGRIFQATSGDRAWSLILGERNGAGIRWSRGWSAGKRIAQRPGVEVWTAGR
jgi:hypothetical protein